MSLKVEEMKTRTVRQDPCRPPSPYHLALSVTHSSCCICCRSSASRCCSFSSFRSAFRRFRSFRRSFFCSAFSRVFRSSGDLSLPRPTRRSAFLPSAFALREDAGPSLSLSLSFSLSLSLSRWLNASRGGKAEAPAPAPAPETVGGGSSIAGGFVANAVGDGCFLPSFSLPLFASSPAFLSATSISFSFSFSFSLCVSASAAAAVAGAVTGSGSGSSLTGDAVGAGAGAAAAVAAAALADAASAGVSGGAENDLGTSGDCFVGVCGITIVLDDDSRSRASVCRGPETGEVELAALSAGGDVGGTVCICRTDSGTCVRASAAAAAAAGVLASHAVPHSPQCAAATP